MKRRLITAGAGLAIVGALLFVRALIAPTPLQTLERVSSDGRYTGSIHIPRGGPAVLGFQCPKDKPPCELHIDGRRVARGTGLVQKRIVYDAGIYDLEFVSPGDGRLLWHPPGRRGPPEYIPASSLSASPAAVATFSRPGTAIVDGVISLLILLTIVATIALLVHGVFTLPAARRALRSHWSEVVAVFAIALAIRLIGLGDAGQTWDEDVNWSAGKNYITNLLALDFADGAWIWNLEHPPLMKYVAGIGAQFADGYGPARALSAVMMSLACALLVPIAGRLGLGRAGLYGGIVAALSPHLIGHGQIVGHESAMALTWALAITAALCVWPTGEGARLEVRLAIVGAAVGLAISARFVNGLVGPLVYAIVVVRAPAGRRIETAWKAALIMPAASVLVFMLLWPRMWSAPIEHLKEAWAVLKKPHSPEPYLGTITNRPARHYFAVYLIATAPLGLLVAALAGVGRLAVFRAHRRAGFVVLLWLLMPMVVMFSPVRQDGIRYIIPSLFALALVGGIGVHWLGELARSRLPKYKRVALAAPAALLALYMVLVSAAIRPYFIDYYGEHVGGPERVARTKSFEIAWWGEGVEEAIDVLNERAEKGARVYRCVAPNHLTWMRGDLWAPAARRVEQASWAVVYAPLARNCPIPPSFELVYEVRAGGAPLARVYRRPN